MESLYCVETELNRDRELAVRRVLQDADYTQEPATIDKQPWFIHVCPKTHTFYYSDNTESADVIGYETFLETSLRELQMQCSRVYTHEQDGLLIEVLKGDGETTPYGAVQITANAGHAITPDVLDKIVRASRQARNRGSKGTEINSKDDFKELLTEFRDTSTAVSADVMEDVERDPMLHGSNDNTKPSQDSDLQPVLVLLQKASHKIMAERQDTVTGVRPELRRAYQLIEDAARRLEDLMT